MNPGRTFGAVVLTGCLAVHAATAQDLDADPKASVEIQGDSALRAPYRALTSEIGTLIEATVQELEALDTLGERMEHLQTLSVEVATQGVCANLDLLADAVRNMLRSARPDAPKDVVERETGRLVDVTKARCNLVN